VSDRENEEARLASSEASKEADLAIDKAKQALRLANESLEKFMADYDALKRSLSELRTTILAGHR
jgi:transaldolase